MTYLRLAKKIKSNFLQKNTLLPVPKYIRLCEVIINMLESKSLNSGDKVPPERELVKLLSVSPGTVQKAMNMLTQHGILTRIQGKGTFVSDQGDRKELHNLLHFRFIGAKSDKKLPVFTTTIAVEKTPDRGVWGFFFGAAQQEFVCITRRININGKCDVIGQYYLRHPQFAALLEEPPSYFNGLHLREIVRNRFGISTGKVTTHVLCAEAPNNVRAWLGASSSHFLICRLYGYDLKGAPLSFHNIFIPPNTYPMEIRNFNQIQREN